MTMDRIVEIPLEELTTPRGVGLVLRNRWWVSRNGHPVGYRCFPGWSAWAPQCDTDRDQAEKLAEQLGLDELIFIPVAYLECDEGEG